MSVSNHLLIIWQNLPWTLFLHSFLKEVFCFIFLYGCASLINELTSSYSGLKTILFLVLTKFQLGVVKLFHLISALFWGFASKQLILSLLRFVLGCYCCSSLYILSVRVYSARLVIRVANSHYLVWCISGSTFLFILPYFLVCVSAHTLIILY